MALNSTPRRRFGVALGVVLSTVATGLIGFAGTAGAHTPKISAGCDEETKTTTLTVKLTDYNNKKNKINTVKVTDGETVLLEETEFGKGFEEEFEVPGDVDHQFTVVVKAWDDPEGKNKWSFTDRRVVEKCVEQPPTETTTTTTTTESSTPSSSETTTTTTTESSEVPSSSSEAPAPSTTTVVPTTTSVEVEEAALAETGASIGLPLGIAGVLIVGGAVALFVVRRRSKA